MKKNRMKLNLSRETIRQLGAELRGVRGGSPTSSIVGQCVTATCRTCLGGDPRCDDTALCGPSWKCPTAF